MSTVWNALRLAGFFSGAGLIGASFMAKTLSAPPETIAFTLIGGIIALVASIY